MIIYIYIHLFARMSYMNMNFNQHKYLLKFKKDLLEGWCFFSQKFTNEIPGIKMVMKTTFFLFFFFGGWWLQIGKGSKCEAEIYTIYIFTYIIYIIYIFAICIIAIPTTVSMIAKQHLNLWLLYRYIQWIPVLFAYSVIPWIVMVPQLLSGIIPCLFRSWRTIIDHIIFVKHMHTHIKKNASSIKNYPVLCSFLVSARFFRHQLLHPPWK